jgi:hypothetical protein
MDRNNGGGQIGIESVAIEERRGVEGGDYVITI